MPQPPTQATRQRLRRCVSLATGALVLIFAGGWAGAAEAQDEECLDCHSELDPDDGLTFADGSQLSATIDAEHFAGSVHRTHLSCVDCHQGISEYPHPEMDYASARAYQVAQAKTCNRCHYAYYTRVLDGIHYAQLAKGNTRAPTCVDCHGAHATQNPGTSRPGISKKCATCHAEISATYEASVHGRALVDNNNQDVPSCTDCHGAHAIRDPRRPDVHAATHTICAKCHDNKTLMAKYDLSSNVLTSYLDDFHGASNLLYAEGVGEPRRPMATCTSCHGVHNIQPFNKEGSRDAVRARVATLCRNCHEAVPDAFADAWLSHYDPTPETAPLVWLVLWAYRILIPMIVAGLVLHILLHLYKVRRHRRGGTP